MTNRIDGRYGNRSSASRVAHVIERVGLALAGALCGLFVAALLARADMEMLGPVDLALAMMLLGIIGFYLGIDMPTRPVSSSRSGFGTIGSGPKVDFAELFSALGVFLATVTALVSVYVVMFDGMLPAIWVFGVGGLWLSGATLQIAAGTMVRLRGYDHGLGRGTGRSASGSLGRSLGRSLANAKSAKMLVSRASCPPTLSFRGAARQIEQRRQPAGRGQHLIAVMADPGHIP
jgi:hypothetical protein